MRAMLSFENNSLGSGRWYSRNDDYCDTDHSHTRRLLLQLLHRNRWFASCEPTSFKLTIIRMIGRSFQLAKLFVSGVERVDTRCITGDTVFNSCRGFTVLDLPAGTHNVQVRSMFCPGHTLLTAIAATAPVPLTCQAHL